MNWDIKGCREKCVRCGYSFTDGDLFNCRLFLEDGGPRREDYCTACWEGINTDGNEEEFSKWQGVFRAKPPIPKEEPVKEPAAKRLLEKWMHSADRLHQCFCYVLAVLLERKRRFTERPAVKDPDGTRRLVYEDKDTGKTYIIFDPSLTLNELSKIEKQLEALIQEIRGHNTNFLRNQGTQY